MYAYRMLCFYTELQSHGRTPLLCAQNASLALVSLHIAAVDPTSAPSCLCFYDILPTLQPDCLRLCWQPSVQVFSCAWGFVCATAAG